MISIYTSTTPRNSISFLNVEMREYQQLRSSGGSQYRYYGQFFNGLTLKNDDELEVTRFGRHHSPKYDKLTAESQTEE